MFHAFAVSVTFVRGVVWLAQVIQQTGDAVSGPLMTFDLAVPAAVPDISQPRSLT